MLGIWNNQVEGNCIKKVSTSPPFISHRCARSPFAEKMTSRFSNLLLHSDAVCPLLVLACRVK